MPNEGYDPKHFIDQRWEFMALSGVSMIYTLVNIACMLVMAYLFLRVKEVVPLGSLEPNKRFFTKDIKVARDYNRRMTAANIHGARTSNNEAMGDQILSEWAEIAGLDAKTLLSDKPEARVTRRQTLHDIIADVNADNVYQSVTRSAVGLKNAGSEVFLRRLTNGSIYRKSSINPVSGHHGIFDIESSVTGRFQVQQKRRGSKWLPSHSDSVTNSLSSLQHNNVDSIPMRRPLSSTSSVSRGLRPEELDQRITGSGRRSSVMLQKTLKQTDHSPFSLWPSSSNRDGETNACLGSNLSSSHPGPEFRRRKSSVAFARRQSGRPHINTTSSSPVTPRSPRTPVPVLNQGSKRGHKGKINESFESE